MCDLGGAHTMARQYDGASGCIRNAPRPPTPPAHACPGRRGDMTGDMTGDVTGKRYRLFPRASAGQMSRHQYAAIATVRTIPPTQYSNAVAMNPMRSISTPAPSNPTGMP